MSIGGCGVVQCLALAKSQYGTVRDGNGLQIKIGGLRLPKARLSLHMDADLHTGWAQLLGQDLMLGPGDEGIVSEKPGVS